MIITEEIIKEKFTEYNKLYFKGKLPEPEFNVIESYNTFGYFSYVKTFTDTGRLCQASIDVTRCYDWTEEALRDVIVHEMIHYWLAYKRIDKKVKHGKEFMQMCNEYNEKYGLHLAKKYRFDDLKQIKKTPKKRSWGLFSLFKKH